MNGFDGKVVLISGAARGIGAAGAMALPGRRARRRAATCATSWGRRSVAQIQGFGGEATFTHLDVTDEESWRDAVTRTLLLYGRLDVLVNNAGILLGKGIEATTVEEWNRILRST